MPQLLPKSVIESKVKRFAAEDRRTRRRKPESPPPTTEKSLYRNKKKPLSFEVNQRDGEKEVEFATIPWLSLRVAEEPAEKKSPRLIERVRDVMRLKHYS